MQSRKRVLLVTLDAFETIFYPTRPVPEQYAFVANKFNFPPGSPVAPEEIQSAFKEAYKIQLAHRPNYGRDAALRGEYGGPRQWWGEVIRETFAKTTRPIDPEASSKVPAKLVAALLDRFGSSEGYSLYSDVQDFLKGMNALKVRSASTGGAAFDKVLVGVISNSDDRVPLVLRSLGLRVGVGRALEFEDMGDRLPGFENVSIKDHTAAIRSLPSGGLVSDSDSQHPSAKEPDDLDFIVMSYQAGAEKPSPVIFRAAERAAATLIGDGYAASSYVRIHVGDDYKKDYLAARDAGWNSYFLDRVGDGQGGALDEDRVVEGVKRIHSLLDLLKVLEREYSKEESSAKVT